MQQFFSNRYFKMALLTLVIAAAFVLVFNIVLIALGFRLPLGLQLIVSVLAAGYLVYTFFGQSIQ